MMNKRHLTALAWPWRLVLVFAPLAAIVLVFVLVTSASAAQVSNIDYQFSGSTVNPCNGENVTFSEVDHFTLNVTYGANGRVNVSDHDNIHITGVGDQGNTYVANSEDHFVLNGQINNNGQIEGVLTSSFDFAWISQGSAPNFESHALVHVVVHPDGTATANVEHFPPSTCRG
jgi:hypothetical protein